MQPFPNELLHQPPLSAFAKEAASNRPKHYTKVASCAINGSAYRCQNLWDEVAPGIVLYLEFAALQAGNTLEHRLDDVPFHAVEEVNPSSLQVLIHLRIQQHLEILDVEWRSLRYIAVQSATLTDNMSCACVMHVRVA